MNLETIRCVASILRDKNAKNIVALDVHEVCSMTDALIIAEGTVDRHVKTLAQEVVSQLALRGLHPTFTEGASEGDWIVLDYLDFIVHLFVPALRDKYRLEELWGAGELINLNVDHLASV